jgi:hypothetical protein
MMPTVRMRCERCNAGGKLYAVGAVWDEGAAEKCLHFADSGLMPVLSECPHMRRLIEGARQPITPPNATRPHSA